MSEAPQVTDGELGWDAETVSKADVSDLEPHPKNTDIYGEEDLEDSFVNSVREKGVLEPLVITRENRIISGHRRHKAAKRVGVETVPVRYSEFDDELAEREALIEFNRQREKTPGQITNEFEEILEIEQERAQNRKKHKESEHQETFPDAQESDTGQARDKAAEKVNAGVSGRTLEKGLNVKEKAQEGDEVAQEQWDKLQNGETSFSRAEKEVRKQNNRNQREEKREKVENAVERADIPDGNPIPRIIEANSQDLPLDDESVDIVITSPPYNLGHDEWNMGGEDRESREDGIGYDDDIPEQEYQQWQLDVFDELYRVASDGASFFYNHKPRQRDGTVIHPIEWLQDDRNPWTVRQEIVWDRTSTHNHSKTLFWPHTERVYWLTKGKPTVPDVGVGMPDVWEFHGPKPNTDHPAPFVDELPAKCLEAVACEGDVVLDPFGGSMTTCEVAAKVGHPSIGVDVETEYVERARARFGIDTQTEVSH